MFFHHGLLIALLAFSAQCYAHGDQRNSKSSMTRGLNIETADGSNAHLDQEVPDIRSQLSTVKIVTQTSDNPLNSSVDTPHDESLSAVLSDPDNKGIIVRSLIVLAALTVLIVVFFVLKLIRLRLKQRRRRRYDDGDRIEMQRLEDMDDEENDEVEVFDQSSLRRGRAPNGKSHQNGSLH